MKICVLPLDPRRADLDVAPGYSRAGLRPGVFFEADLVARTPDGVVCIHESGGRVVQSAPDSPIAQSVERRTVNP
jgi:hypothetical protein